MGKGTGSTGRFGNTGQTLLIIGASLYLITYFVLALARLSYPFELEWMEGGSVVQVQRILDGQSLYVTPSLTFVPFIYSPFYFYVSSLFAHVTGNGFLPLRLVSFVSSLGCFALIFMIVHRRTSSVYASFMASGLYAATFRLSGSWFDLARVDSLSLFLLLAGIFTFDSPRKLTRSLASPLLLFLSFFTKQTALIVAVCLLVTALVTRRRLERYWFPLIFSLLLLGSFLIMNTLTGGWYKHYVLDLPAEHDMDYRMVVRFLTTDVGQLAIALCVAAVPILRLGAARSSTPDRNIQDVLVFGSLFLGSLLSRIHVGGYENVLMPVYAGIAIYFGIGFAASLKVMGRNAPVESVLVLAVALQFVVLFYWPGEEIPSAMDRRQGEKLEQLVSGFKGEVYMSDHPWYLGMLGRATQAHRMAVKDLVRSPGFGQWGEILGQDMVAEVKEKRYEAFILDAEDYEMQLPGFKTNYMLVESNLSESVFHPVTGLDRRPTLLYVRRTVKQNGAAPAATPGP